MSPRQFNKRTVLGSKHRKATGKELHEILFSA